jgi:polysaccharide transporter, PST family
MIGSNALLVYAAQACRLAAPILILPIISRKLSLDQFAALAAAQALAYVVMLVPEYGFATHGPRMMARLRDKPAELAQEASRILRAKLLLCIPAALLAVIAGLLVPTLLGDWRLIAAMTVLGVMLGMNPGWFFQGIGAAKLYAVLDIAALLSFLALVLFWPFGTDDAWLVLSLQAATLAAAVISGHWLMARQIPLSLRGVSTVAAQFRRGFSLFVMRVAGNVPGLGLLYIIGFALTQDSFGHYAAAERLMMGSANALWPVMQILMPEIAERSGHDQRAADRIFLRGLAALMVIGIGLGAFLYLFAPWIVSVLFGPNFTPTVGALQMIAFALPCIALSNAIAIGFLVPRGRDWLLSGTIICAALLSAVLAFTLIGPSDFQRVPMIRFGVELALAALLCMIALVVIRKDKATA